MTRLKKLRLKQIFLLVIAVFLVLFTYTRSTNNDDEEIVSKKTQQKIEQNLLIENNNEDK